MKPSSSSLFAMLLTAALLAGCATTGSTPASSGAEDVAPVAKASTTEPSPAPATAAPAAKSGGAEPECD